MRTLVLRIDKECTTEKCPIPPSLLSTVENAISKVKYTKKTEKAEIEYDEKLLSEGTLMGKLRKIGYKVKKW